MTIAIHFYHIIQYRTDLLTVCPYMMYHGREMLSSYLSCYVMLLLFVKKSCNNKLSSFIALALSLFLFHVMIVNTSRRFHSAFMFLFDNWSSTISIWFNICHGDRYFLQIQKHSFFFFFFLKIFS